jgi:hypothetical protein
MKEAIADLKGSEDKDDLPGRCSSKGENATEQYSSVCSSESKLKEVSQQLEGLCNYSNY